MWICTKCKQRNIYMNKYCCKCGNKKGLNMDNKCINTAMTACFWCNKPTGIAISSKLVDCKDKFDTKYVFGGYEPCDECKEKMKKGFTVMVARDKPISDGQPEIQENVYPTGIWFVLESDCSFALDVGGDKCYVDDEFAIKMGLINDEI